jgi:hypothetical protein
MALRDLIQVVDALPSDELETPYAHIREQLEQRRLVEARVEELLPSLEVALRAERYDDAIAMIGAMHPSGDRDNDELDINELRQLSAAMREDLTEKDLEELEWAMNVEYIELLDDDE